MSNRKAIIYTGSHVCIEPVTVPLDAASVQVGDCIAMRDCSACGRVSTVLGYPIKGEPHYRWNVIDCRSKLQTIYDGEACVLGQPEITF